ncbi:MAG: recombinase family protein [Terriglobales bacterium]
MKNAVIYARVSSKEQEEEGYSIPAQLNLLREYARSKQILVVREFVSAESAKAAGRKEFGEMVRFLEKNPDSRIVLAEKTDRLYRNFNDLATLDDLADEIHLVKEGRVLSKDSKSSDKLVHGILAVLAKGFIDNLREEVKKGMREKARQGIYPTRAPFGYRNNIAKATIEIHPENSLIVNRMFELYAPGNCPVLKLRKQLWTETGRKFARSHIHKLLRDPFYAGFFYWQGEKYKGTHPLFIEPGLYQKVQDLFESQNRPKNRRHEFPFSGLATCALCGCALTAEIKKGKYIYYHCTQHKGKCSLPYFPQEELARLFAEILRDIYVPDSVLQQIVAGLSADREAATQRKEEQRKLLDRRLADVRRRVKEAYTDKVDRKITEEFWTQQNTEWLEEEQGLLGAKNQLESSEMGETLLTASKILELANKLYSLYLTADPARQGKLLKMVLSNCAVGSASLSPTYRKPFDLIFQRAKTEEWYTLQDDFRTLLDSGFDPELLKEAEQGLCQVSA